jgi:hypothetical protein
MRHERGKFMGGREFYVYLRGLAKGREMRLWELNVLYYFDNFKMASFSY